MKYLLLLTAIVCNTLFALAQTRDTAAHKPRCDNQQIIDKTSELVRQYKEQGYYLYQGDFYKLEHNSLMPVLVNLIERTAYGFIVVGQPDLDVLEVALGHNAFGKDEIRDLIRGKRDGVYYTYFTYVPSFTGTYLLSVRERANRRKEFCTAVYVLVKPAALNDIR
jgi:hypothetical protein